MTGNDWGIVLQAVGGLCWLAGGLIGSLAPGLPEPWDILFGVSWLVCSAVFLMIAGQSEAS